MKTPILYFKNVFLGFGGQPVLNDISFNIYSQERICLVGRNGSGKSTLMKLITGVHEADKGEIYLKPGTNIGYLPQELKISDPNKTVYDYLLEDFDEEQIDSKRYLADIVLEKLKVSGEKMIEKLSGGKFRRMLLAKSIINEPNILLLDEPTNHLDIASIEWLEKYLNSYNGSVICVSHDRAFLSRISNKTFWIDRGYLKVNNKGYASFSEFQEQVFKEEEKRLQNLEKRLQEDEHWLIYGVTARRKRNQNRLSRLLDSREKLAKDRANYYKAGKLITLPPLADKDTSKLVFEMENVSFAYTDVSPPKQIIKNLTMRVLAGEKIGLMGRNGAGKSTFLNLITGKLAPTNGTIKLGAKVEYSYFDQRRDALDHSKTLWETLCPDGGDHVKIGDKHRHVVAYLKDFLFDPTQAKSPVGTLSGGEANRLLLAKILINPGNFLILDEPTNDLDADTLELLEELLTDYQGTLLVVSHDREFLDNLVTRTIIIDEENFYDFIGGFSDAARELVHFSFDKKEQIKQKSPSIEQKNEIKEKVRLSYKEQREYDLLPDEISKLEEQIRQTEEKLADPDLYLKNPKEFDKLSAKLLELKQDLEQKEHRWLEISLLHDNLNKGSN